MATLCTPTWLLIVGEKTYLPDVNFVKVAILLKFSIVTVKVSPSGSVIGGNFKLYMSPTVIIILDSIG